MRAPTRLVTRLATATVLLLTLVSSALAQKPQPKFSAAYFNQAQPPRLQVFPMRGPKKAISLPDDLPFDFRIVGTSGNGMAMYGSAANPLSPGIVRVDLDPPRLETVPGTTDLTQVRQVLESQEAGHLVVNAMVRVDNVPRCGVFDIDAVTGARRTLYLDKPADCHDGPASPDSKRMVTVAGENLGILDFDSGLIRAVNGVSAGTQHMGRLLVRCVWSPDGRWIAAVRDGHIVLISSADMSHRTIGSAENGLPVWSPDSKWLLVERSQQLTCALTLYGSSLQVIDVSTGKRSSLKSSRCEVMGGTIGWVASAAAEIESPQSSSAR